MPKSTGASPVLTDSLSMPIDCSIRTIGMLAKNAQEKLESGAGLRLDCSSIEQADITFVQFVVSAERSFASRGLPLILESAPAAVLSAFARAGVKLPGAA